MRDLLLQPSIIQSPFGRRTGTPLAAYAANGFTPQLVVDNTQGVYAYDDTVRSSFSDVITHSRSGNATMVDAEGNIVWAPHNLWLHSDDLEEGILTSNDVTVSRNTLTATEQSGFQSPFVRTNFTFPTAAKYTFTVNLTNFSGQATHAIILFQSYTETIDVNVRMSDGVVTTDTTGTATTESTSDGYILSFDIDMSASGDLVGSADFGISERSDDIIRITDPTTADSGTFSRIHLYRSDLGGMANNPDTGDSYVPTTDTARYLPRRGHHVWDGSEWVNEGLLIESEARTNSFLYSENLADAVWSKASNTTVTASGNTARVQFTSAATDNIFQQACTATVENQTHTVSMQVRSYNGGPDQTFRIKATHGGVLDYFSPVLTATSQWQDFSFSKEFGAGGTGIIAGIANDGTNASDVEVRYLQVELNASTPSSYIPTNGSTATRAAETLTIDAANLPYPEPVVIGPELVTNGTFDTDIGSWTNDGTSTIAWNVSGYIDVDRNGSSVRSGALTAQQEISGLTVGRLYRVSASVVSMSNAASVQVLNSGKTAILTSGGDVKVSATGDVVNYFTATETTAVIGLGARDNLNATASFDNISVREINPLAVSIGMEGRMTYADTGVDEEIVFFDWRLNTSNRIYNRIYTIGGDVGGFVTRQVEGGTGDQIYEPSAYSPGILVPFNIASRHTSRAINGAVDGTALTEDTTPVALPDLSATDLELAETFMGTIKTFRMWGVDIGDTGIEEASS